MDFDRGIKHKLHVAIIYTFFNAFDKVAGWVCAPRSCCCILWFVSLTWFSSFFSASFSLLSRTSSDSSTISCCMQHIHVAGVSEILYISMGFHDACSYVTSFYAHLFKCKKKQAVTSLNKCTWLRNCGSVGRCLDHLQSASVELSLVLMSSTLCTRLCFSCADEIKDTFGHVITHPTQGI